MPIQTNQCFSSGKRDGCMIWQDPSRCTIPPGFKPIVVGQLPPDCTI
jgi:hypothetical protein